MRRLKEEKGSIMPGLLLFLVVIITIFVFMFETGLLFLLKQRSEGVAKNISSSVILQIDEDYFLEYGEIWLRGDKDEIANKILENSNLKTDLFQDIKLSIKEDKEIDDYFSTEVEVNVEMKAVRNTVFYKDLKIKANSRHRATLDDSCTFKDEESEEIDFEDVFQCIIFEEVF